MSTAYEPPGGAAGGSALTTAEIQGSAANLATGSNILGDDRRRGIASLRRHTAQGMLVNSAFDLSLVGLSALRGLVVAAFLTRSDYGVWGLLGLTMWTALGLKNQFGAGDKYVQQSEDDQELAFQRAFTVEVIFAAAVGPIAAAIVVGFALISGHSSVLAPGLALLLILPSTALQFPLSTFYRRMDYRRQRTLQVVDPLGAAVVTILLAILGAGYWSFVVGVLFGSWSGAIVAVRASPYRLALRYHPGILRSYIQFSGPLLIAGLAGIAMFQVIYLVGNDALGLAGLGAFTLAGNFVQFTDQADAIVTQTLYPAVCTVRTRLELLAEIFVKSNRLSLMWAVPFGVGLSLFCEDLFRFAIGTKWLPAVPLLEIMGLVTALNHVGYNWSAFFMARGQTRPIAVAAVVPVAALIASGVPLMYSDGITGLGYAFAFGAVISLTVRGILLARFFQGFRLMRHLLRAFLPTFVAAVPILALRALEGREHSLVAALAVFALYVVLTVIATMAFERPLVREALGYLVKRRVQVA
jgi:O-antigen/teichoic acid export membrane protein